MRKVTRIVAATMTAAALSLLTAMPLVIIWRMPAGQCIAPVSINPLNLADQAVAMPLVAGQCTIAASSPKSSDWIDDAPAQRWPAISVQTSPPKRHSGATRRAHRARALSGKPPGRCSRLRARGSSRTSASQSSDARLLRTRARATAHGVPRFRATSLGTSGRLTSSKAKFGGMALHLT
jgi:hypothetical protein